MGRLFGLQPTGVVVLMALLCFAFLSGGSLHGEPVRIGVAVDTKTLLVRLAYGEGFFQKQGIEVLLKECESGVQAVEELLADRVDLATAAEFVFVVKSAIHPDLRMIATIGMASDTELVTRTDRIASVPRDLTGKKVALLRGSVAEFFLHNYLLFNGIPMKGITIVDLPPSRQIRELTRGNVDAAVSWPPFTMAMASALGDKARRRGIQEGQEYYFGIVGRQKYLPAEGGKVERVVAALAEAQELLTRNPERAQETLRKMLGTRADAFLRNWPHTRFELQLTQDLLVLMEREARFAMDKHLIEKRKMPNFLDYLYFPAMDRVKPQAVSIVH